MGTGSRIVRAAGVTAVLAAFGGCAASGSRQSSGYSEYDDPAPFGDQVEAAIEEAEAGGASERQVDLLEAARDRGQVTVEMAREANRNYAACAQGAGLEVTLSESSRGVHWVDLFYATGVPAGDDEATAEAVMMACETAENSWVGFLYQTQPIALQATLDYLDQQAPILRSCLLEAGFEPDPDANALDLARLAISDDERHDAGLACLLEAEIDGF